MGAIRELPHNHEAEQGILGLFLLGSDTARECFVEYAPRLGPSSFYALAHRLIYESILAVDQTDDLEVGLVTVVTDLEARGKLNQVGGAAYIANLTSIIPSTRDLRGWVKIVVTKALQRQVIELLSAATAEAYQGEMSPEDIAEKLSRGLGQLMRGRTKAAEVGKILQETMIEIEDRAEGRKAPGLMTRFHDLNLITHGFHPGDLFVLAARPSMGKTSLVMCLAKDVAVGGARVLVFSLEMKNSQLVERMLAEETGIPLDAIRTGNLERWQRTALDQAAEKISRLSIKIDDQAGLSIGQLRARAKAEMFKGGADLIVVDYLQLVCAPGAQNREREVSQISAGLKALAKELNVPVIALSQLNRSLEGRQDPTPKLSDLRDSGSIEQDADVIAFISRPKNGKGPMAGKAELVIAKHRNGATGNTYLGFEGHCCRFSN